MYDTLAVVQFEARVKSAQLSKRKADLDLEMAKSKLNLLREYTKPKRLKNHEMKKGTTEREREPRKEERNHEIHEIHEKEGPRIPYPRTS